MATELSQRNSRQRQQELDGVVPTQDASSENRAADAAQGDDANDKEKCKNHHHGHGHSPFPAVCRNFLASPVWKCITLVVVGVTPVFGTAMAMPKLMEAIGSAPWSPMWLLNYCFAAWVSMQFLYNFLATQWTDPGGCKAIKPDQEVTGQFEMDGSGEPKLLYAPNWCQKCSHWKPPRSHHCSMCGRCTLRMDHHCPFTGNCIGLKNHGHFVLFFVFAFIGLFYSLALCVLAIYTNNPMKGWQRLIAPKMKEHGALFERHFMTGLSGMAASILVEVLFTKGVEIMLQTLITGIALIAVLSMGTPALHLAWSNTTTMERMFPMKEYVQIKEQVYCPLGPGFYRHSGLENLKVILGPRWWLRLMIPTSGGPTDLSGGINPLPSEEGAQALRDRVQQVKEQGVQQEVKSCHELGFDPGPQAAAAAGAV